MPDFRHDGLQFHYLDSGSGTPFVFQHGLGASARQPEELYRPQAGFRFLALDCRYHGETRPLGEAARLTFDTLADDVLALLDRLEVERAVVGGISLGAGVALNFAARYPARTLGLVLSRPAWLDSPLPDNLRDLLTVARYLREHGRARGLELFQQSNEYAVMVRRSPDSAASLLSQFADARAEEAVERLERLPSDAPVKSPDAWTALRGPALVLVTRNDALHPLEYGEALASGLPEAQLQELTPKSVSFERHRQDTQTAIADFLHAHFA